MSIATLSSKNQMTLPKAVRQALRAKPGDRFSFVVKNGTVTIKKQKSFEDYFDKGKDIFPSDAVAYQRKLRDNW